MPVPNGMLFVDVAHFFYQAIIPNGIFLNVFYFKVSKLIVYS